MMFSVSLSGLLLIFLLPHWTQSLENEAVDLNTLAHIIDFFEQHYNRTDPDGHARQYATAINVPKHECQAGFIPSQNNFLTHENAEDVKKAIKDESRAVYQGEQLIAAGNKKMKKNYVHSESLLLKPAKNSLMTNLLNRNKEDCSIFYTLNSPCVNTCLDEQGQYNILQALDIWSKYSGIKAFVFKDFWKYDTKKDLESKFKLIASHIPLYRCESKNLCYACKGEGDTAIDQNCLPSKTNTRHEL